MNDADGLVPVSVARSRPDGSFSIGIDPQMHPDLLSGLDKVGGLDVLLQVQTNNQFAMWRDTLFLDRTDPSSVQCVGDSTSIGKDFANGGRRPVILTLSATDRPIENSNAEIGLGQDAYPPQYPNCVATGYTFYAGRSKVNELDTDVGIVGSQSFNSGTSGKTEFGFSASGAVGSFSASGWTSASHGYPHSGPSPEGTYRELWENVTEKRISWNCWFTRGSQNYYPYTVEISSYDGPNTIANGTPPSGCVSPFNFSYAGETVGRNAGTAGAKSAGFNVARSIFSFSGNYETAMNSGSTQSWTSVNGGGHLAFCGGSTFVSATRIDAQK